MREDVNLQWRVKARPKGNVKASDFELTTVPVPAPADGEFLLRTLYLGVRPVMRMYMQGLPAAGERPIAIGDIIHGRGVAQVAVSNHPDYRAGDIVHGQLGWQTWKATQGTPQERFLRMPATSLPCVHGVGALGMNGFSAYCGLLECGSPQAGETVVVSAAAGGVGSTVVQIARILGCHVIGIAGGPEKCALLTELGCSAAVDYKHESVAGRLEELCPDGIDVYFDNVGGTTLQAVLENLAMHARIVLCGSISEYTLDKPFGLTNYTRLRSKNASMTGFFVYNFAHLFAAAGEQLAAWIEQGELRPVQNIVDGFAKMPEALAELYSGANTGVQICRVRGEPDTLPPVPDTITKPGS